MEKMVYSVPEAANVLGISKSYAYELVRMKRLPIIDFGRRKVIPIKSLETWLQENVNYVNETAL